MRIFVFGNINAGKSYVVGQLKQNFVDYPILKIDDYRIQYGDGTVDGEILAQDTFVKDASEVKDAIIESTGMGPLGTKLANMITHRNSIILKVEAPLDICLQRLEVKDFTQIPYPKVSETLDQTITRCHNEFQNNGLETLWQYKVIDLITIHNQQDITKQLDKIPLHHYKKFSELIDSLIEHTQIDSIVSYGSLGRGELTKLSDIDMYVVTKLTVEEVLTLLTNSIHDIWFNDYVGDKITLRFTKDNLLIEIIVLKHLYDGERYYLGSIIDDITKTIYKISNKDMNYLKGSDYKANLNIQEDIDYLVKEILYFLLSLDNIIQKQDWYKYYFHNNIIVHNYIRIKALITGVEEFNYLPRNALQFLDDAEINALIYNIKITNALRHQKLLYKYCGELFEEVDSTYKTQYVNKYQQILNRD